MEPKLLLSLRGHSLSIACTLFVENLFVSGDVDGTIFIWDLNTKRPRKTWKAHDANIILLHLIKNTLDSGEKQKRFLVSHSRDSTIKFWNFNVDSTSFGNLYFEFPVNSLNFCNVSISSSNLLLTPSTVDSNNFDVYKLGKSSPEFKFARLLHNIDPNVVYEGALKTLPFEIVRDDGDATKRDGFGIMMRTVWVSEEVFYVGYESGHIIGFHISDSGEAGSLTTQTTSTSTSTSLINKPTSVRAFHMIDSSVPNPVISLVYDKSTNTIAAGSSSKYFLVRQVPMDTNVLHVDTSDRGILLKHAGLSQISMLPGVVCVGFWNGSVKGFDTLNFEEYFVLAKNLPVVDKDDNTDSLRLKLTTVECKPGSSPNTVLKLSAKELVRARKDIYRKNLLALGFENGILSVFEVSLPANPTQV